MTSHRVHLDARSSTLSHEEGVRPLCSTECFNVAVTTKDTAATEDHMYLISRYGGPIAIRESYAQCMVSIEFTHRDAPLQVVSSLGSPQTVCHKATVVVGQHVYFIERVPYSAKAKELG